MSNVASLELCKELYELSGWEDTEFIWYQDYSKPVHIEVDVKSYDEAPAYDLGYLLRKLQPNAHNMIFHTGSYTATYDYGIGQAYVATANTPEDAACKLAIELWKQGVLR